MVAAAGKVLLQLESLGCIKHLIFSVSTRPMDKDVFLCNQSAGFFHHKS